MASDSSPAFFRLNSVDRLGRKIDPAVLIAAEEVFPRALEHGTKLSCDPAVVANVLEEVAADLSERIEGKDGAGTGTPIRNVPGYVFHSFVRQLNRLKSKQLVLVSAEASNIALTARWADPSAEFETKILVDEYLAQCDFVIRDMFWRRAHGFSWGEVGEIHSMSGHAAEVRFRRAIGDAQKRLAKGKTTASKKPADRIEELRLATQSDVKKQTTRI
jgi:hypothetical protein